MDVLSAEQPGAVVLRSMGVAVTSVIISLPVVSVKAGASVVWLNTIPEREEHNFYTNLTLHGEGRRHEIQGKPCHMWVRVTLCHMKCKCSHGNGAGSDILVLKSLLKIVTSGQKWLKMVHFGCIIG